jgi:hypothetical protein
MSIVVRTEQDFVIVEDQSQAGRVLKIDRKVYEAAASITVPTGNGEVQTILAKAMGVSAPGGRSSRAASFLERYTFGYGAFNGWCSVFVATNQGKKRFFQFNPGLGLPEQEPVAMLTKSTGTKGKVRSVSLGEDLDVPDTYVASIEEINSVIDRAYEILGYDPANLTDDAPDLSYDEALVVVEEQGA